ncbi:DNA-binding response regulator [Halobacteriovorax marinus]|uniref:Phosphate regulon transcriptional regulatory protein n=1 Tax=Halobacteriovorax marinus (strain ATCC BAA-682 / DSM 15412 / SJ) TaxID=862908 RepID=E1X4V9_HALMS|nr:response regulator transcription factor [Halobacteriovorax marinus]ATH08491.1 DNA-binding response regulator [Halobacteriovorax marinus]CBW27185.1 phosphate regulon transcriptional regulatory protein [Halobacteriovorax marinus SJ]
MAKGHILVVEDERDISDLLKLQLQSMDYQVTVIENGDSALELIQTPVEQRENSTPIDLYILDRMLPGTDGLEICKFLRMYRQTKEKPILMVTALTEPEHIIEGLDAGGDDYINKPFDINILAARVRSLMRRSTQMEKSNATTEEVITLGPITLDMSQCKVSIDGSDLDLTLSEYKLMVAFFHQPGKVLTRNQLVEFIQDGPVHVTDRTIDTHVFGLRKKLGDHSELIETIRGIGYRVKSYV